MPLTPIDIKTEILKRGDTQAGLARKWGVRIEDIARVIHRDSRYTYPIVRKKLAQYMGVPVSEVGREPIPARRKSKEPVAA